LLAAPLPSDGVQKLKRTNWDEAGLELAKVCLPSDLLEDLEDMMFPVRLLM
jgi:hypothetical protein